MTRPLNNAHIHKLMGEEKEERLQCSMAMELHPVILAGGRGSRMYPLTETCPKALLPVGNKPLIWYPIQLLEKNGFEEVTVVVRSSQLKPVSERLEKLEGSGEVRLHFSVAEVSDDDELGSADTLRSLRGRVKNDLLVLSCDLITTVSLYRLWDLHQKHHCSLTLLLTDLPSTSTGEEHSRKTVGPPPEQDLIGLDASGQVVFHSALVDVDEELHLSKAMLRRHPHFRLHSRLLDAHLYIISRWVLDYLHDNRSISSIKGELVPHLVRHQGVGLSSQQSLLRELAVSGSDSLERLAMEHSTSSSLSLTRPLHCHALLSRGDLCLRANTILYYIEANRMVQAPQYLSTFHLERSQPPGAARGKGIGGDSLVGSSVQVAERASIKRSTVGHHCTIGDKTRVINSILMDYVTLGEGCVLQSCIVCNNCRIEDRAVLKDCIIGADMIIAKDADHRGDVLARENELTI